MKNLLLLCRVFPRCFPGISRAFPGCFPSVPRHNFLYLSFTLLKFPTAFAKIATLIQNISKCTFPWCFPGIPRHNFLYLSFTLLKIPTTFAKEVFSKPAPLMQNISECTFPGCFMGVSRVFPGLKFFVLFYFVKNPHNFC